MSREQWESLLAAVGLPAAETDVGKVLAAVAEWLQTRRVDARRRDATIPAAPSSHRIPLSRVEFWSRAC